MSPNVAGIAFFRMMCFIIVKEQGGALFTGQGYSGNKSNPFCICNQANQSCIWK